MGLPLFPAATLRLVPLPFRVADFAAFLEDLLHEVISGKDAARAAPILGTSRASVIGNQGVYLSFQCCHSLLKRRSGHDGTPPSKKTALWSLSPRRPCEARGRASHKLGHSRSLIQRK
jgi:hypothetical protein